MVHLPWTKPPLSMNDRGLSRGAAFAKARQIREIRELIYRLAQHHRLPKNVAHAIVQLHYRPCDNRRRDTDNLIATLKPICDGLTVGTNKHPGYGLVLDDTPEFMAKPEPIIHRAGEESKRGPSGRAVGELWLDITITEETK